MVMFLLRILIVLIAFIVYLVLLPIQIDPAAGGLYLPPLFRAAGSQGGDPVYWNYILLLPISLIIIAVGFEILRLFRRNKIR